MQTEYLIRLECRCTNEIRTFDIHRYVGFMDFAEILLLVGQLTAQVEAENAVVYAQKIYKMPPQEVFSWNLSDV